MVKVKYINSTNGQPGVQDLDWFLAPNDQEHCCETVGRLLALMIEKQAISFKEACEVANINEFHFLELKLLDAP